MRLINRSFSLALSAISSGIATTLKTIDVNPLSEVFIDNIQLTDAQWTYRAAFILPYYPSVYTRLTIERNGAEVFRMDGQTEYFNFPCKQLFNGGKIAFKALFNRSGVYPILNVVMFEVKHGN